MSPRAIRSGRVKGVFLYRRRKKQLAARLGLSLHCFNRLLAAGCASLRESLKSLDAD